MCNFRGGWEAANPAGWIFDKVIECELCLAKTTELRVIHYVGKIDMHGYDHLMVCKKCFNNKGVLKDWHACGCGG